MNSKNIIVGVDFSNSSKNAMRHAVSIALKTGADLHLIWVKTPGVTKNAEDGDIISPDSKCFFLVKNSKRTLKNGKIYAKWNLLTQRLIRLFWKAKCM